MSRKHKHRKPRGERVICPICFDNNTNDRIELRVRKGTYKWTEHPIVRKNGKIEIDYGMILNQETKSQFFILDCPKCGYRERFKTPETLISDIEPLVEYIAENGAFNDKSSSKEKIKEKGKVKEEALPQIVRISKDATAYKH